MDATIAAALAVDGIGNGAIYAMLGMAIVLVFAVTRVILIPQGEFVAYGALTLAMMQLGRVPGTAWFAASLAACAALRELYDGWRAQRSARASARAILVLVAPALSMALAAALMGLRGAPLVLQAAVAVALVTSLGPLLYRIAWQPVADGSVLLLLIVSVGVHFVLVGVGLVLFGPEGYRTPPFWDASFTWGASAITGQTVLTLGATIVMALGLWQFFSRTLAGKALRATAIERLGARLVGVRTEQAGRQAFALAAFIGALCGVLVGSGTTMVYDGGFLIGLKGFIAATFGGLASYPAAVAGALVIGLLDSFSSFWASAFKDALVFGAILPVLLLRSLGRRRGAVDD